MNTTKNIVMSIRRLFKLRLARKTGWGRNEVMEEFDIAMTEAALTALAKDLGDPRDKDESPKDPFTEELPF